jgi:hypothetical protein
MERGTCRVVWDGRDGDGNPNAAGVYFVRCSVESVLLQKKLVLLK